MNKEILEKNILKAINKAVLNELSSELYLRAENKAKEIGYTELADNFSKGKIRSLLKEHNIKVYVDNNVYEDTNLILFEKTNPSEGCINEYYLFIFTVDGVKDILYNFYSIRITYDQVNESFFDDYEDDEVNILKNYKLKIQVNNIDINTFEDDNDINNCMYFMNDIDINKFLKILILSYFNNFNILKDFYTYKSLSIHNTRKESLNLSKSIYKLVGIRINYKFFLLDNMQNKWIPVGSVNESHTLNELSSELLGRAYDKANSIGYAPSKENILIGKCKSLLRENNFKVYPPYTTQVNIDENIDYNMYNDDNIVDNKINMHYLILENLDAKNLECEYIINKEFFCIVAKDNSNIKNKQNQQIEVTCFKIQIAYDQINESFFDDYEDDEVNILKNYKKKIYITSDIVKTDIIDSSELDNYKIYRILIKSYFNDYYKYGFNNSNHLIYESPSKILNKQRALILSKLLRQQAKTNINFKYFEAPGLQNKWTDA